METFQSFLCQNFKYYPSYDKMTKSSQPERFYAPIKNQKFNDFNQITIEKLKSRSILDQKGTGTYDAAKIIDEYLKSLACNKYKTNHCLMLKGFSTLQKDEEYDWYDVDSLSANFPLKETIDYTIHKIYNEKLLKPVSKNSFN